MHRGNKKSKTAKSINRVKVPKDALLAGSVLEEWMPWEVCSVSVGWDEDSGTEGFSLSETPSSDDPVETVTTAGTGAEDAEAKAFEGEVKLF